MVKFTMADLLWGGLMISLVLLLGINIGLSMGLTQSSIWKILSVSALCGVVLLVLSMIANYIGFLYDITNEYIPYVVGIIGAITLINGIYTIIRWKKEKEEYYPFTSVTTMIPLICLYMGFFFTAILLNTKNMVPDLLLISIIMALIFTVIITLSYLFSNFLKHAERPYPVLLANFMILIGFFFLIIGLFIPIIKEMTAVQTDPLIIGSSSSLIFLIMAGVGVLLIGVYLRREGKPV